MDIRNSGGINRRGRREQIILGLSENTLEQNTSLRKRRFIYSLRPLREIAVSDILRRLARIRNICAKLSFQFYMKGEQAYDKTDC